MKEEPQDLRDEQLHNAPDAAQEETESFSLEDILDEFGGWSRREPQADEPPAETAQADEAPQAGAPAEEPQPDEAAAEAPDASEKLAVPQSATQDTVRFTPIRAEDVPPKPEVWRYEGEPLPENAADAQSAAERREARREEQLRRRREQRLAREQARQKRAASRRLRRQERPDAVYATVEDALAAYGRRSTLRLRLIGSFLLCLASAVLLLLANIRIGGIDLSGYRVPFSLAMLAIMLGQMLLAYDVFVQGILQALRLRFDHLSLLVLLTFLAAVDAFFALAQGRLPLCPIVSVQILLAQWSRLLLLQAKHRSARVVCAMQEPVAVVREEKAWHGKDCIFRGGAQRDEFAHQLEMPDAARRVMRVYAPLAAAVTLVLAALCSLRGRQNPLWCWAALLTAAYPTGALISFSRPFALVAKRLQRGGAAVAGWHGARDLSGECGLVVEDADLFPQANVTLNGMKIYSDRGVGYIAGYATAVVETAGSGLVPLFQEILQSQNGRRFTVDTFRRYEGGGLGAEIRGDVVLMGSLAFMRLMRVQMPPDVNVKQAVYLSVNGELAAVFALHYAPASKVSSALTAAVRTKGLTPVLATRDFMITPQFLRYRYKLPPERVEFPTVEERAWLSSPDAVREPKQGALLSQGSFLSFVSAVTAARSLRSTVLGSLAISLVGGILGLLMVFLLAFIGSVGTASCWNLAVYMVLWMIPQLLLTAMAGRSV